MIPWSYVLACLFFFETLSPCPFVSPPVFLPLLAVNLIFIQPSKLGCTEHRHGWPRVSFSFLPSPAYDFYNGDPYHLL